MQSPFFPAVTASGFANREQNLSSNISATLIEQRTSIATILAGHQFYPGNLIQRNVLHICCLSLRSSADRWLGL